MPSDLTTKQGCVDAGVIAFAALEDKLKGAQAKAADLLPIFDAAYTLNMLGALQYNRMKAKLNWLSGVAAQAETMAWELHWEATGVAVANGVDPPVPQGGGSR